MSDLHTITLRATYSVAGVGAKVTEDLRLHGSGSEVHDKLALVPAVFERPGRRGLESCYLHAHVQRVDRWRLAELLTDGLHEGSLGVGRPGREPHRSINHDDRFPEAAGHMDEAGGRDQMAVTIPVGPDA